MKHILRFAALRQVMISPFVQHQVVLLPSREHLRTDVTAKVCEWIMIMAARKPRLVAGGTEREAGSGNHVGSAVELQVVGVELEEVREVAAALKKARERMRKSLVGEEGCTSAENREAELAFLEQRDVLTTVAKSSDFFQLLCNTIIYVLHLDDTFKTFRTLGPIHP